MVLNFGSIEVWKFSLKILPQVIASKFSDRNISFSEHINMAWLP